MATIHNILRTRIARLQDLSLQIAEDHSMLATRVHTVYQRSLLRLCILLSFCCTMHTMRVLWHYLRP